MGSCQSFKVVMAKENLNGADTKINDQLKINTTQKCKPMLQYYNCHFYNEPGINLVRLKLQSTAILNPNQQDLQEYPQYSTMLKKRVSQSLTQKGILKTQLSSIYSQNTSKKIVSFDKNKKRVSTRSLMKCQNVRRRKVTMEMLEATF